MVSIKYNKVQDLKTKQKKIYFHLKLTFHYKMVTIEEMQQ